LHCKSGDIISGKKGISNTGQLFNLKLQLHSNSRLPLAIQKRTAPTPSQIIFENMKLQVVTLLLLSTAATAEKRQRRLNEKPNQRRESSIQSNDNGKDWFETASRPSSSVSSSSSSSSSSSQSSSTPKPSPAPASSSQFQGLPSLPISSRMGCPSGQRKLKFAINVDKWGAETTWEIRQLSTDQVVLSNSRTYGPYDEEVVEQCVDSGSPEMQYELTLFDEVVSAWNLSCW
jgi:hypothetical protein